MAIWTGSGDGASWSDPHNWLPALAPNYVSVTISPVSHAASVVIGSGQTYAAQPLTLGASGIAQSILLTNAGSFTVDGGPATFYAGTELLNKNSVTLNGGAVIYGSLVDQKSLVIEGGATIQSGGTLEIDSGGTALVDSGLADGGTVLVKGTLNSSTGITGAGAMTIDGGTVGGGSGNPLNIASATTSFTILDGGTLNVTPPAAGDSFAFGAVGLVVNTLIMPSYSGRVTSRITNFAAGDTIKVGASGTHSVVANGDGSYTISYGNTGSAVTLADVFFGTGVNASDVRFNGGVISVICFAEGTRIRTPDGEVPVETLHIGDHVLTASGKRRPIRWIGQRTIDLIRHGDPDSVRPVRIRRDALGERVPSRDLCVSPDHALYVDGVLIPARQLVNGVSIRLDRAVETVRYYHAELDAHDVLLAENAPAESYLDTGNRAWFANEGPVTLLRAGTRDQDRRHAGCAPFVTEEAIVEPIWCRIAERAGVSGTSAPAVTDEPDLRVLVGDRVIPPVSVGGGRASFALPQGCARIVLGSHHKRPSDVHPWHNDRRRLGVAVARIALRSTGGLREIPVDDPRLGDGWWEVEGSGAAMRRWTDGAGTLALDPSDEGGPAILDITLAA